MAQRNIQSVFIGFILLSTAANAFANDPVTVDARIEPVEKVDHRFRVVVNLEIENGWHAYSKTSNSNPSLSTRVKLDLPDGASAIGDWKRPTGMPDLKDPETMVLTGKVSFSREFEIKSTVKQSLGVRVNYQVCNERMCMPPEKFETKLAIPAIKKDSAAAIAKFSNKYFETPLRLMVDGKPLNTAAKQMYPSPAWFDVDNDGQAELVVGDIFGSLNVYENSRNAKGDPVWQKFTPLKSADDKPVKVSNW